MKRHTCYLTLIIVFINIFISCNKRENLTIEDYLIFFPQGGEIVIKGNIYTLSWIAPHCSEVDIELYNGVDKFYPIEENLANYGKYEWEIPAYIPDSLNYYIKISNSNDISLSTICSGNFEIRSPGQTSFFTDIRDEQTYKIVLIGNQWWMAQNYNYNTGEGSSCYDNNESFCDEYGKMYTQEAAIINRPDGWHLPSDNEWKELESWLGMSTGEIDNTGNRGDNEGTLLKTGGGLGFDALYGGYHNSLFKGYGHKTLEAHFWTSTITQDGKPVIRVISKGVGGISRVETINHDGSSVRYVKDNSIIK